MNHKLIPSLIALMAIGSVGVANADNIPMPTVYGKVNVTLNKYNFDDLQGTPKARVDGQDNWQLESNSSRLGVKGDVPLADGLKAVYKLEYEVFADGSSSNAFTQRNTYGGLQGAWGTLIAGKNDTPLKAIAAETVQPFKDLPLADFKYVMVGENRETNIIQYSTPNMSGFVVSAMFMPGEDSGEVTDAAGNKIKNQNHGIADRFSAAATYKLGTLYVALADDQNVQNTDTFRFVAQYGLGSVALGGLYQKSERHDKDVASVSSTGVVTNGSNNGKIGTLSSLPSPNSSLSSSVGNPISDFGSYKDQDAYVVEAAWKIDQSWTLKGQYAYSSSSPIATTLGDTTAKNWAVGFDYNFSTASRVFAYYAAIKTDGDVSATTSETLDDKTYAVGYELKF